MKRTPLKPGNKPLRRKTPLKRTGIKRPTLEEVREKQKKKRAKPKSRNNGSSDKWLKKADRLWSKLIWLMHGGECAMCGEPVPFEERHTHHAIGRGVKLFRHDPDNGFLFDGYCHNIDEKAPHKSAKKFMEWLRGKYPERAKWLEDNQGKVGTGKPDYEARCKELERLISEWE